MKNAAVEQHFDAIVLAPGYDLYGPIRKRRIRLRQAG